jgi:hypothetical protein
MGMGQRGGRRLDSDVRQLQGSWGSRQFSSTEHVYPSPRASINLSATLSSHDLGCNEVFATTTTAGDPMHNPMEFATPLSHYEERIDAFHDGAPLRYRTMENLLGYQPVPRLVPHDLEAQLHLACDDGEPRSFAEAERRDMACHEG